MFCPACGASNADDASFCEKCGRALGKPATRASATRSAAPYDDRVRIQQVPVKNPGLALVLSLFLPGAGQLYNGQIGKGAITIICFIISCAATGIIVGFFGMFGIWLWSMIDAYKRAKEPLARG